MGGGQTEENGAIETKRWVGIRKAKIATETEAEAQEERRDQQMFVFAVYGTVYVSLIPLSLLCCFCFISVHYTWQMGSLSVCIRVVFGCF